MTRTCVFEYIFLKVTQAKDSEDGLFVIFWEVTNKLSHSERHNIGLHVFCHTCANYSGLSQQLPLSFYALLVGCVSSDVAERTTFYFSALIFISKENKQTRG